MEGDAGVAGVALNTGVRCNVPRAEGQAIVVLGEASVPGTAFIIEFRAGKVTVQAYGGSGSDYHERHFEGTGVVGFDAANGVDVEASLASVALAPGKTPGTIGTINSIKGSVDCGKQTAGTATVTITGATAEGTFDNATLDPVLVECSSDGQGNEAFVTAVAMLGSVKAEIGLGLSSGGAVDMTVSGGHHYTAPGTTAITATGAHVNADVVEQEVSSPHTLHVEGDVACGTRV
ncbi:MAG: hypothetical protein QOD92_1941 [Acidimicrobiaceae bacterium]